MAISEVIRFIVLSHSCEVKTKAVALEKAYPARFALINTINVKKQALDQLKITNIHTEGMLTVNSGRSEQNKSP